MNIRIYDNGGKTLDRYTCVYLDDYESGSGRNKIYGCVGMSENPFDPQGFGCHSSAMCGNHLGKRISFDSLPLNCQKLIQQDLNLD